MLVLLSTADGGIDDIHRLLSTVDGGIDDIQRLLCTVDGGIDGILDCYLLLMEALITC